MIFFLAFTLMGDLSQVDVLRTYQNLETASEESLARPYAAAFAPDGALYLLDYGQSRILMWHSDGSFHKGFGSRGEGPGQLDFPLNLSVSEKEVWVWENKQRMSIYDRKGHFIKAFPVLGLEPRVMGHLSPDLALIGSRDVARDGWVTMNFSLFHRDGTLEKPLKSFKNGGILTPLNARLDFTMKAFSPEIDIQPDGRGNWFFGFSQQPTLYRIDASGKVVAERSFQIPTGPATEEERQHVLDMSFPGPNGSRISMKSFPNLKVSFDHDKAYYTHFLIKGDQIAFVLTPIGTGYLLGTGYGRATYYISDFKTGAVKSRGAYDLGEDAMVFYRNNRILACILDESESYQLSEISLKGLK